MNIQSLTGIKGVAATTAFGEALVGQLSPIFQHTFEYTVDNTRLTTNTVTGGGTITQADGKAVVSTSTTTGSTACLQSKRHARYKSGMGGVFRFTLLSSTPAADTEMLAGLADETGSSSPFKNGYMVGSVGVSFGFYRFANDATTYEAFDDPLDGSGRSGVTIDHSKLNVFQIQFKYLGAGAIRVWMEDPTSGDWLLVHTSSYANANTAPSVHNPNFYGTLWTANTTTTDVSVECASFSYFIEGRTKFTELHQPVQSSDTIPATAITAETAIFTIRVRDTYHSKSNFIEACALSLGASYEANQASNLASVRLVLNATIGGTPSYSDINTSDSVLEIDTAGTTVTGGVEVGTLPLSGKNDRGSLYLADFNIVLRDGETLTVSGVSANSADFEASLLMRELF
jgi:hypothetical protein